MWSEYSLEVVDAVARNGSFSAAAQELHRVPSAVSYTGASARRVARRSLYLSVAIVMWS